MPDEEFIDAMPQHLWPKLIALEAPEVFGVDDLRRFFCHVGEPHDPPAGPPPAGGWQTVRAYQVKDRKQAMPFRLRVAAGGLPGVADVGDTVRRACDLWQAACSSVQLEQRASGDVDLSIGFSDLGGAKSGLTVLGSTSGDGSSITFNNGSDAAGVAYVDWDEDNTGAGISFFTVVAHEIGHALGLLHATTRESMMYPTASAEVETLSDDDVSAIRVLYGWEGQRHVAGVGTSTSPALCSCGTRVVMAWKGASADQQIWFSTSYDGINWAPQRAVPDIATSHSPSLAFDGIRLWMAWKGRQGDPRVFFSWTDDFHTWAPQQLVANAVTSHGPAVAIDPRLHIPVVVCKGSDTDERLYWTMMLAENIFLDVVPVMGVATSDRPVLCAVGEQIRMAWKGAGTDSNVWSAVFDSSALGFSLGGPPRSFWTGQEVVSWVTLGNANEGIVGRGHIATQSAPALAGAGDKALLAWRGAGDDKTLRYTQHRTDANVWVGADLESWSQATRGPWPAGSSDGPALAVFKDRPLMAWKGIGTDQRIWTSRL